MNSLIKQNLLRNIAKYRLKKLMKPLTWYEVIQRLLIGSHFGRKLRNLRPIDVTQQLKHELYQSLPILCFLQVFLLNQSLHGLKYRDIFGFLEFGLDALSQLKVHFLNNSHLLAWNCSFGAPLTVHCLVTPGSIYPGPFQNFN